MSHTPPIHAAHFRAMYHTFGTWHLKFHSLLQFSSGGIIWLATSVDTVPAWQRYGLVVISSYSSMQNILYCLGQSPPIYYYCPRFLFSFFLQGQCFPKYLCCPQQCCFLDKSLLLLLLLLLLSSLSVSLSSLSLSYL